MSIKMCNGSHRKLWALLCLQRFAETLVLTLTEQPEVAIRGDLP